MIKKISIVSLVYNNYNLLDKAIKSLDKQKLNRAVEIEYIIADDCSSEICKDKLYKLIANKRYKTKIIINDTNLGTVKSFNNAISQSSGDLIIPLSPDDYFYNEYSLSIIVDFFNRYDYEIATSSRAIINGDGVTIDKLDEKLFMDNSKLLSTLILKGNVISGACTYYRRAVFENFSYFDEKYDLLEDYPFYISWLKHGNSIGLINEPIIFYSTEGVSSGDIHPRLKNDYAKLNLDIIKNNKLSFFERRAILFNRVLYKKDRRSFKNVILYLDQVFLYYIRKVIN